MAKTACGATDDGSHACTLPTTHTTTRAARYGRWHAQYDEDGGLFEWPEVDVQRLPR